jgi:solute carrier family 25 carnitine/acylcarnitine transporter 20/29
VGWTISDSILLGSLHNYRLQIAKWEARQRGESTTDPNTQSLSLAGHTMAGVLAGWTVSFFVTPLEHLKAKLQLQVRCLPAIARATRSP